jgi:UDP-GlcNAc:undecaprenyl-phosphate/decaprenyl-phosphate GlcNAc-1-phosphate transferase
MSSYLTIFLVALILAIVGTPVARRVARRAGIVDSPNSRKLHVTPMPLLGGVAIYGAFLLAVLLFEDRFRLPQLVSILVGATFISFLGIWDDSRGLRPLLKLEKQVVAALILVASGIYVELFPSPLANYALTVVWLVGITNSMNLLDNMDGLTGGIAAVSSAFFLLMAASSGQVLVGSLAAALLGACLGFLRYNLNPASIFMGDTGSLFIGFILAAVGIKLHFDHPVQITWMIPVLVLGLPILDTTLVTVSRLRRGCNPLTTPGKDHISHRLVALGLTHREAVLTLYLACGALGMAALFLMQASLGEAYALASALVLLGLLAIAWLEKGPPGPPRKAQPGPS